LQSAVVFIIRIYLAKQCRFYVLMFVILTYSRNWCVSK